MDQLEWKNQRPTRSFRCCWDSSNSFVSVEFVFLRSVRFHLKNFECSGKYRVDILHDSFKNVLT